MALALCILASGSAGNCAVVRTPGGVMLIDAGIGPRVAAGRMDGTGVALRDIRSICLTHLDSDHFRPSWLRTIVARGIRLFCAEPRRRDLLRSMLDEELEPQDQQRVRSLVHGFNGDIFQPLDGVKVHPIPLAHDQLGSYGFVIDGFGCRLGYASDLGHVPPPLIERFCDLDVLALESNYDPQMELGSARPWFVKNRIMGGRGHLSNQQAFEAICAILDRCQRRRRPLPEHIVLLHRSRQCNCPRLVRRLFERDDRIRPRLTLGEQFQRSEWLRPRAVRPHAGEQMTLAW